MLSIGNSNGCVSIFLSVICDPFFLSYCLLFVFIYLSISSLCLSSYLRNTYLFVHVINYQQLTHDTAIHCFVEEVIRQEPSSIHLRDQTQYACTYY